LVRRYVDPNDHPGRDAFTTGRVALSWSGHWNYPGYQKALGKDLMVLPLPDFSTPAPGAGLPGTGLPGTGAKTGSGSWAWGIATRSQHPQAAGQFLDFLMSTDEVLAASQASGAPPGTASASLRSPLYRPGGSLVLFSQALAASCGSQAGRGCVAVSRPPTPAYPVITNAFQDVIKAVFAGRPAMAALRRAGQIIDQDNLANDHYGLDPP
jgi:multiple sugar transport system substrate-binding protein